MKFFKKDKVKKAQALFDNWEIEKAESILTELYSQGERKVELLNLLAMVKNSMNSPKEAITLLKESLYLFPNNKDTKFTFVPIVLELATTCEDVEKLEQELRTIHSFDYKLVGIDMATVNIHLAQIHKNSKDYTKAEEHLNQAKNIYRKQDDSFFDKSIKDIETQLEQLKK